MSQLLQVPEFAVQRMHAFDREQAGGERGTAPAPIEVAHEPRTVRHHDKLAPRTFGQSMQARGLVQRALRQAVPGTDRPALRDDQ